MFHNKNKVFSTCQVIADIEKKIMPFMKEHIHAEVSCRAAQKVIQQTEDNPAHAAQFKAKKVTITQCPGALTQMFAPEPYNTCQQVVLEKPTPQEVKETINKLKQG